MSNEQEEHQAKLIAIIREAVQLDISLREKFQVGDKFRFVRDRLQVLLQKLEADLEKIRQAEAVLKKTQEESVNDVVVYIYLYNAQGVVLKSWINMLSQKVFNEYSINRPIYAEKNVIDGLIRSKANKMQHAYLTVAIKPDMIKPPADSIPKDALGNPLMRVKEGAFKIEKLVSLTHNEDEYVLTEKGVLVKKDTLA